MKITLVAGFGEYYRPCCICGQGFETGHRLAMAYDGAQRLGYVCSGCMKDGADAMKTRLGLRAQELQRLADQNIDCPIWEPEESAQ
jgi:hypothetical protein